MTSERFLRRAIGAWTWVVVEERTVGHTAYRLVGVYTVSEVREDTDGFTVSGPGTPFEPPLTLDDEPWFQELRLEQSNFSFGYNRIGNEMVVAELDRLLGARAAATDSIAPDLRKPFTFYVRTDPSAHERLQVWRRENPERIPRDSY